MGPISRACSRHETVERLRALLARAAAAGAGFVVFPELALTTFFPRWLMRDPAELDSFFEESMPNGSVQPLFDDARRLSVGFYLGYAERVGTDAGIRRYNTSV